MIIDEMTKEELIIALNSLIRSINLKDTHLEETIKKISAELLKRMVVDAKLQIIRNDQDPETSQV